MPVIIMIQISAVVIGLLLAASQILWNAKCFPIIIYRMLASTGMSRDCRLLNLRKYLMKQLTQELHGFEIGIVRMKMDIQTSMMILIEAAMSFMLLIKTIGIPTSNDINIILTNH